MILASNIYEWLKNAIESPTGISVIVVAVLTIIEVTPIKINPWSWLGSIIGRLVGIKKVFDILDALEKKVDNLKEDVDELDHKVEENDIVASRVRILRFASEIQSGIYHNKDSWDQTMMDVGKYEKYVCEHPNFKNGITEPTIEFIREQYKERLEKHDWEIKR